MTSEYGFKEKSEAWATVSPIHEDDSATGRLRGRAALAAMPMTWSSLMADVIIVPESGLDNEKLVFSADDSNYSPVFPVLFADSSNLMSGQWLEESVWVCNDYSFPVSVSLAARNLSGGAPSSVRAGLRPSAVANLAPGIAEVLTVRIWVPGAAELEREEPGGPVSLVLTVADGSPSAYSEDLSGGARGIWPMTAHALLGGAGAHLEIQRPD